MLIVYNAPAISCHLEHGVSELYSTRSGESRAHYYRTISLLASCSLCVKTSFDCSIIEEFSFHIGSEGELVSFILHLWIDHDSIPDRCKSTHGNRTENPQIRYRAGQFAIAIQVEFSVLTTSHSRSCIYLHPIWQPRILSQLQRCVSSYGSDPPLIIKCTARSRPRSARLYA